MEGRTIFDSRGFLDHTGNDPAFAQEIIHESLKVIPEYMNDIRTAAAAGNMDELRRASHRFKGGMKTIYAHAAAGHAEEIEKAAAQGDQAACSDRMKGLESVYTDTISELERFLKTIQ